MRNRDNAVDFLKGFGMLCVMYGHTQFIPIIGRIIYTFHMPLFFLLSGCFFRDTWSLRKMGKSLLVPYLFFLVLTFVVNCCLGYLADYNNGTNLQSVVCEQLNRGGYFDRPFEVSRFSKTIWFLPCLFMVSMVYAGVNKYLKRYLTPIVLCMFTVGVLLSYFQIDLPFFIDTILTVVLYYHIGRAWYEHRNHPQIISFFKYAAIPVIACLVLVGVFSQVDVEYKYNIIPFWNHPLAIMTILSLYYIFSNIGHNYLCTIGQESIIYFGLHRLVYSVLLIFLSRFLGYPYLGIAQVLFAIPIIFLVSKYLLKYTPFLIGKSKS